MLAEFDSEVWRYGRVIDDAGNPVGRLRIIANTPDSLAFLTERARSILGDAIDIVGGAPAVKFIVMAPGRQPLVPSASLIGAARERYGDVNVQQGPPGLEVDSYLYVTLPHERLTITTFVDGTSVSFESGDAQVADAIAWYRSLLPAEYPRVIAFDPGWNGHVELPAGIRGEDIVAGWIDHSVDGWDAGDPDLS